MLAVCANPWSRSCRSFPWWRLPSLRWAKNTQTDPFSMFWGYRKWHFGCPNQNSKTTFQYKYPPKTPIQTLWEPFWTPEKWFLAILLLLVIFPLKFPLKPKNTITMGRSWATEETKYVLRPVKQWEQFGNMHNLITKTFLNKNPPNVHCHQIRYCTICHICHICSLPPEPVLH